MIPDNVKIQVRFFTSPDKLIVQATCSKDSEKYVGQISVNTHIDFQLIKEILQEGDFKILTKTEDLLKIRIGATVIELVSTLKSQIKELKETLQKSFENLRKILLTIEEVSRLLEVKQKQIEKRKKSQIEKTKQNIFVQEIKKIHQSNAKLTKYYRWSQQLKHYDLLIDKNIVSIRELNCGWAFSYLQVGFTGDMRQKQCWAMKMKVFNHNGNSINLGVSLKSKMSQNKFYIENFRWGKTGHGCYLIDKYGKCHSNYPNKLNGFDRDFAFRRGDVIYVQYDPIEWKLRFRKNKYETQIQMPIPPPPQGDAYHPFVGFNNYGSLSLQQSVQLIYPVSYIS